MRRGAAVLLLLLVSIALGAQAGGGALFAAPLSPALVEAWTSTGTLNGEEWGAAVAAAGDLDGDGYDDILVGAPKYGPNREGGAFIYYGGPAGLAKAPGWQTMGEKGSRYGTAVAGIGDFNCDGYLDIAVGAPEYNNADVDSGSGAGAVYVFFGSKSGFATIPEWSVIFQQGGSNFGFAVTAAGRVNGDDCDDLLVGARRYTNGQSNEGAIFLFYGANPTPDTTPGWQAEGNQDAAGLGFSVAGIGDVNGDGYDDIAAGAPYWDSTAGTGGYDVGAVFVYYGGEDGPGAGYDLRVEGDNANARLGYSVAQGGDLNGDGLADLVAGMPGYVDAATGQVGAVLVFHGRREGLAATPSRRIAGSQSGSSFGIAVAFSDVNGDGFDDLLAGASTYTGDQSREGAVFLYLGGPGGVTGGVAWMGEGNKAETGYGLAVAGAGDVNRDGSQDFLVGAPLFRTDRNIVGRAFAYHGSPGNLFYSTYLPFLTAAP
jgi:hypothetical protein